MTPTNHENIAPPKPRFALLWPAALVFGFNTVNAAPLPAGVKLSQTTRVPIRGEYVPSAAAGPTTLTTELLPNDLTTPLLPEGAEHDMVEPLPPVDTKKRWTLTVEARAIYDDNIFLSRPGREAEDFVFLFTPTVSYRRGDTATKRDSFLLAAIRHRLASSRTTAARTAWITACGSMPRGD